MTEALFRDDPYLRETRAKVVFASPRGIALDRTVFYPQGGGQPGDQGAPTCPLASDDLRRERAPLRECRRTSQCVSAYKPAG
jgi:hypothetical protein